MDVLPSVPDPEGTDTAILLTDRVYRKSSQRSDRLQRPGFADGWRPIRATRMEAAQRVNHGLRRSPNQRSLRPFSVPCSSWSGIGTSTSTERRKNDLEPPSILVATLGAAYDAGGELFDVLRAIADRWARLSQTGTA